MAPTLRNKQLVCAVRSRKFRVGDVVIAFVGDREVIKRIVRVEKGRIFLEGDNKKASTDSREYGSVPDRKIEGRVFWPGTRLK